MLLSMTGFGNALRQSESAYVSIELKAVNNRYLKVSMRLPDVVARFELRRTDTTPELLQRGTKRCLQQRAAKQQLGAEYGLQQPATDQRWIAWHLGGGTRQRVITQA